MVWCDYNKATSQQQADFRRVNPKLGPAWDRYQIWVKSDGTASCSRGQWQWTAVFSKLVDGNLRAQLREALRGPRCNKGDLTDFKSCDFHLAPERKEEK
jgi:hypothetical protein